jgi:hypothetical protein
MKKLGQGHLHPKIPFFYSRVLFPDLAAIEKTIEQPVHFFAQKLPVYVCQKNLSAIASFNYGTGTRCDNKMYC